MSKLLFAKSLMLQRQLETAKHSVLSKLVMPLNSPTVSGTCNVLADGRQTYRVLDLFGLAAGGAAEYLKALKQ